MVGMTLRRLVSKVANRVVVERCMHLLAPHQVGVGVRGGSEAAVHTARAYLESCLPDSGILKLDFKNAFNCIQRDSFLECVALHVPELLPLLISAYSAPSLLSFGQYVIASEEGVQQGDPLGPLLFSLCVSEVLESCAGEIVVSFLGGSLWGDSIKLALEPA